MENISSTYFFENFVQANLMLILIFIESTNPIGTVLCDDCYEGDPTLKTQT